MIKSEIGNEIVESKPKDPKGVKVSNFLITINTNRCTNNELRNVFNQMIEYLYKPENVPALFKCKEHEAACCKDKFIEIKIKTQIEIGEHQKRLHAHTLVETKHTGKYHVDKERITKIGLLYMKTIGLKGIYVNIRLVSNRVKNAMDYVNHSNSTREIH